MIGRVRIVMVTALALLVTQAEAARLTFSDGICEYRVTYDQKKVDGARLKASFDYLNDGAAPLELGPSLSSAEDIAAIDVAAYRARCDAHRRRLEGLQLIDVTGIEALRKKAIGELDTSCRQTAASLAAAKGDTKPMRSLAPACTRYVDLLDLPVKELKARWSENVVDLCQGSTEVNICAGQLQRDGEGPGSEARRRLAVVKRWSECAGTPKADDGEKARLNETLKKRFKAKVVSCAR